MNSTALYYCCELFFFLFFYRYTNRCSTVNNVQTCDNRRIFASLQWSFKNVSSVFNINSNTVFYRFVDLVACIITSAKYRACGEFDLDLPLVSVLRQYDRRSSLILIINILKSKSYVNDTLGYFLENEHDTVCYMIKLDFSLIRIPLSSSLIPPIVQYALLAIIP